MQFLWNLLLFGICHLHWQKLNILGIFSSGLLRKYFLRWKITTFQHLIRCYEVDLTTLTASLNFFFFFFFSEYPGVGNNRKIIVSLEHGRTGFIFWKTKYDFLLFFVRCSFLYFWNPHICHGVFILSHCIQYWGFDSTWLYIQEWHKYFSFK